MHVISQGVTAIDHVAIAVRDLDAAVRWYTEALGFALTERDIIRGDLTAMNYAVMKAGQATVVLVQGTCSASQVSRFLAGQDSGLHHIGLAVVDLDQAIEAARACGVELDTPIVNECGVRQAFLKLDPATGVRVELIERRATAFSRENIQQLFRHFEENELC
jgi:methylmalonyl-CoA/ethylmalonyl-CoA epimerase